MIAFGVGGEAESASQGQLGAISTGSVQISLVKAPSLRMAVLSSVSVVATTAKEIAVCVAAQGTVGIEVGVLRTSGVVPLAPGQNRSAQSGCAGESRAFIMPAVAVEPAEAERPITLLAGPL